jgi:hypothetical protein
LGTPFPLLPNVLRCGERISGETSMRIWPVVVLLAAGLGPASAQAPVAVVEAVKGTPPGVEFMDYVSPGKVIALGSHDGLVLSYLKSCLRETIDGGTVTVGAERSEVQGGSVQRDKVRCEAGKMQLSTELASKAGGMVFRDRPRSAGQAAPVPRPQFTLFGLSPVIEIKNGGTVTFERLDIPGERLALAASGAALLRGAFFDLAAAGKALTPGGIYRVSAGGTSVVFSVDPEAQPGQTPLAGRLVRQRPAG